MCKKKQIPFRYNEKVEQAIESIEQGLNNSSTSTKNKVINNAILITAGYLKKKLKTKKFKSMDPWDRASEIENDLGINLISWW
jgi:hypothetical protein